MSVTPTYRFLAEFVYRYHSRGFQNLRRCSFLAIHSKGKLTFGLLTLLTFSISALKLNRTGDLRLFKFSKILETSVQSAG